MDCDTSLGNQMHCVGMRGCGNLYANTRVIAENSFQVLRDSIVTVIADCIRREVRWEINGRSYPFKASFEAAGFPKLGALFRFAVGGCCGDATKIVDAREETILLLKEIQNLQGITEIQKMKAFLQEALQAAQSDTSERDLYFHYDLDSSHTIAPQCNMYIHACGFEDSPSTEKNGLGRYSLLRGFDLELLKGGLSALTHLLHPKESTEKEQHSRFPDELLGFIDPVKKLIQFFVRDRVGGIFDDPNGPPPLAEIIHTDWKRSKKLVFCSDQMQQFRVECKSDVHGIIEELRKLEIGASMTSTSDLSAEMVTEKEVEIEMQVVQEVVRKPPAPVDTKKSWKLQSLISSRFEELPFFPASDLSFHDICLPFPASIYVSRNFCPCKPEGLLSAAHFALNWNDGACTRTTILSLAEAVAVRRAAQLQLYSSAASGTVTYEIVRISQDCKSNMTVASREETIFDWYRRLSCCRFIQGDIWMSWPDDFYLLQAFESSEQPLCEAVRREKWFLQCLTSQV